LRRLFVIPVIWIIIVTHRDIMIIPEVMNITKIDGGKVEGGCGKNTLLL